MNKPDIATAGSALRRRLIDDMTLRRFGEKTQHDYIRAVVNLARFIGRSPDSATNEDLRRFQLHLTENGAGTSLINSTVSALRFFFTVTLDRADAARHLTVVHQPRNPRIKSGGPRRSRASWRRRPASSTRPRSASPMAPACAFRKSSR